VDLTFSSSNCFLSECSSCIMVSHLSSSDFFYCTDLCSSWARVDCVDSSWISFCEEDLAVRRAYWAYVYFVDERR
jgi:hypothetical protein